MADSPLKTLAGYLAGEFENQAQAADDPTWYVHLRLWQRPVPNLSTVDKFTLLLEQANLATGGAPYRQRVLQLTEQSERLQGEYFALKQPLQFQGVGTNPSLLASISTADLVSLPDSVAGIEYQAVDSGYQFRGALPEGKLCSFEYGGDRKYVYLGFDIARQGSGVELKTYDKGIDPKTGKSLWGALMGPFVLYKQDDYRWE